MYNTELMGTNIHGVLDISPDRNSPLVRPALKPVTGFEVGSWH